MKHENNNSIDRNYRELLNLFPPRPITSVTEAIAVQEVMDELIDKDALSQAEQDYLSVLGALVSEYEKKHAQIPDIYGIELLKALIKEHQLKQKDLVHIFKTESIISTILNGKRKFTIEHIQKLSAYFHISPSAFFPQGEKYPT